VPAPSLWQYCQSFGSARSVEIHHLLPFRSSSFCESVGGNYVPCIITKCPYLSISKFSFSKPCLSNWIVSWEKVGLVPKASFRFLIRKVKFERINHVAKKSITIAKR